MTKPEKLNNLYWLIGNKEKAQKMFEEWNVEMDLGCKEGLAQKWASLETTTERMMVLIESNPELIPKKIHTSGALKPGYQAEWTRKANNETIVEGYIKKYARPDNDKPPGSTAEVHVEASLTGEVDTGDD